MEIKLKRNYQALIATVFIFGFTSCRDEIKSGDKENEGMEITPASEKVIWAIFEDSKGDFWFGSNEGVSRYDGKSLIHYSEIDGLGDNQVRTIQEDRYGNIWFDGGAISSYDGKKISVHVRDSSQGLLQGLKTTNKHTSDITENEWRKDTNDLWFVVNHAVYRYDGENFIRLAFPIPNDDDNSSKLGALPGIFHGKEKIWIWTLSAVVGYDGKSFTFIPTKGIAMHVRGIFEDSRGNLWIGSNLVGGYCGLMHYDGNSLTHFSEQNQPGPLARIFSIAEDNAGNMWFGTMSSGVWRFDGKSFINFTLKDGLTYMDVNEIYKDKKGDLWFGMRDGSVCKFNGTDFDKIY